MTILASPVSYWLLEPCGIVESQVLLENARSVARRSSSELTNFDVGTAEEPFIITDAEMQI